MFLGYPYGIKDYKVLDLESNSINVSRDIIFYEHIFHFVKSSHPYVLDISPSISLNTFVFPHCVFDIPDYFPTSDSMTICSTDSFSPGPIISTSIA